MPVFCSQTLAIIRTFCPCTRIHRLDYDAHTRARAHAGWTSLCAQGLGGHSPPAGCVESRVLLGVRDSILLARIGQQRGSDGGGVQAAGETTVKPPFRQHTDLQTHLFSLGMTSVDTAYFLAVPRYSRLLRGCAVRGKAFAHDVGVLCEFDSRLIMAAVLLYWQQTARVSESCFRI